MFLHEDAVYGITVNPENGNVFATACDDGRVLVYDMREPPATGTLSCHFYQNYLEKLLSMVDENVFHSCQLPLVS